MIHDTYPISHIKPHGPTCPISGGGYLIRTSNQVGGSGRLFSFPLLTQHSAVRYSTVRCSAVVPSRTNAGKQGQSQRTRLGHRARVRARVFCLRKVLDRGCRGRTREWKGRERNHRGNFLASLSCCSCFCFVSYRVYSREDRWYIAPVFFSGGGLAEPDREDTVATRIRRQSYTRWVRGRHTALPPRSEDQCAFFSRGSNFTVLCCVVTEGNRVNLTSELDAPTLAVSLTQRGESAKSVAT